MKNIITIVSLFLIGVIVIMDAGCSNVSQHDISGEEIGNPIIYEEGQIPLLIVKHVGEENYEAIRYLWDTKKNSLEKNKPFFKVNHEMLDWAWDSGEYMPWLYSSDGNRDIWGICSS